MRTFLLATALSVAMVACDNDIEPKRETSPRAELATTLDAVCRAMILAGEGNVDESARVFQDRAHAFLHELAAKGADAVPAPTARMLESKRQAEAAFAGAGPPDPALVQHLIDLHDATRELGRELGMGEQPPCQGAVA